MSYRLYHSALSSMVQLGDILFDILCKFGTNVCDRWKLIKQSMNQVLTLSTLDK